MLYYTIYYSTWCKDFHIPGAIGDDPSWPRVPLAFSVVAHDNLAVLTRLLRLLFRPRHAFCMHVDSNAPRQFRDAVSRLVDCYRFGLCLQLLISCHQRGGGFSHRTLYPGAKMLLKFGEVHWGHISLLDADLGCLRSLLAEFGGWKFYANLAGSELPRFVT